MPPSRAALRLAKTVRVKAAPGSFVVVVARGTRPLSPVVPADGKPVTPVAISNPIWLPRSAP